MDYEGFLEVVRSRRSIRQFKSAPIPDEYVDKIIEAARWAPSGANIQPWEFVVIKKQELKDKIVELIMEARGMYSRLVRNREEMVHYDCCGAEAFRTDEEVKEFLIQNRNRL